MHLSGGEIGGAAATAVQEFRQTRWNIGTPGDHLDSHASMLSSPLSPTRTRQTAARVGREQRKEIAQHASTLSAQAGEKVLTPAALIDRQLATVSKVLSKHSPHGSPRTLNRSVAGGSSHATEAGLPLEGLVSSQPSKRRASGGDGVCAGGRGYPGNWGSMILASGSAFGEGGADGGSVSARRGMTNIEPLPLSPHLVHLANSPRNAISLPSPRVVHKTPRFGAGTKDQSRASVSQNFSPQVPRPAPHEQARCCGISSS